MPLQLPGGIDDDNQARQHLFKELNTEGFEQNLEQRRQRPQQYLVEPALHNVPFAELIQIETEYIEESQTGQGETINKQQFLKSPTLQGIHPMKEDVEE